MSGLSKEFENLSLFNTDISSDIPQVQDITAISREEEEARRVIDEMKPVYHRKVSNSDTNPYENFFSGKVNDTFLHMSRFVATVEDSVCIKNHTPTPPSVHLGASPPPDIQLPYLCLEPSQNQENKENTENFMGIDDVITHFTTIDN